MDGSRQMLLDICEKTGISRISQFGLLDAAVRQQSQQDDNAAVKRRAVRSVLDSPSPGDALLAMIAAATPRVQRRRSYTQSTNKFTNKWQPGHTPHRAVQKPAT